MGLTTGDIKDEDNSYEETDKILQGSSLYIKGRCKTMPRRSLDIRATRIYRRLPKRSRAR